MKIVHRQVAIARGLSKYFNGRPCKRGHIAERYTLTCNCAQCIADANRRARERVRSIRNA